MSTANNRESESMGYKATDDAVSDLPSSDINIDRNDGVAITSVNDAIAKENPDELNIYAVDTLPTALTTGPIYRPILLDIQMLGTKSGFAIKELAYKIPPVQVSGGGGQLWQPLNSSLNYTCFRHDPINVTSHRMFERDGKLYDRYTGLEVTCGEEDYSDERVIDRLKFYNLIFLKGHNKKRLLCELFQNYSDTILETPKVINVDAVTMDEEDAQFCKDHFIGAAEFSFPFVYQRFDTYLRMMFDYHGLFSCDAPVYMSNVIATDKRFHVYARGRPIWVCPNDHTCGIRSFTSQRCAALNVGILETLWYMMRDENFRAMLNTSHSSVSIREYKHCPSVCYGRLSVSRYSWYVPRRFRNARRLYY